MRSRGRSAMMMFILISPKMTQKQQITSEDGLAKARESSFALLRKSRLPLKRSGELEYLQLIWKSKMEYSEEFQPQSCSDASEQRYGRPKQQQKYISGEKNGKWSEKQNTQYIVYIEYHKDKMRSKEKRRVSKLYKQMANFIGTRNALQCRSHHQKLEDRYLYPNKIIANYKQHNDLALYHQVKQELEQFHQDNARTNLPHLKLQVEKMENPTQVDLRPLELNSANTSQDGSNSEVAIEIKNDSCLTHPASFISPDLSQTFASWTPYFYYPVYQIY